MPRTLHHGNPDCCEVLKSYVLESDEIIVSETALSETLYHSGVPISQMRDVISKLFKKEF